MGKHFFLNLLAKIVYAGFSFVGKIVYRMPFGFKKVVATSFAFLFYHIFSFKKRVAHLNLVAVFHRSHQESLDDYRERIEKLAFKNYVHYGLCFLEILERFHWKESDLGKRLTVQGGAHVWTALSKKKGFFFLAAHLGNWELITRAGVLLKYPLAIITKKLRNPFFDALWIQSRSHYGLELLKESGSGISIIKGIQKGKAIGFIFDQYTGEPHGLKALFFGKLTGCPKGLAVMAPRLGAPIIPAYMVRDQNGILHLTMESPLSFDGLQKGDPEFEKKHIEICNKNVEKWVLQYPDQFLWVHKRFKDSIDYSKSRLPWEL